MFSFLFDNNLVADSALWFEQPEAIICAFKPEEVQAALAQLQDAQTKGKYAAGFMSFELGYCVEPRLRHLLPASCNVPLLMFGIFDKAEQLDRTEIDKWLLRDGTAYDVADIETTLSKAFYRDKYDRALEYIAAGDIYQLNLTFKAKFRYCGSLRAFYRDLRRKQHVRYGAFIETDDFSILSLSPELFIETEGDQITSRPMKGTARRGLTRQDDQALQNTLATDLKSRAENLMIVDLMRNDLSRIALPGSVHVADLFTVEPYDTVLQLTSGVSAQLPSNTNFSQIFHALYPAGSIIGAPKMRGLEIIKELENEPRGIYTGAIGFLRPYQGSCFNVAIRTLIVDRDGVGEIGIGSGLVQDSNADAEYDECLLKLQFLTAPPLPEFALIETMLYTRSEGFVLLDRHIYRLNQSALRFSFKYDDALIRTRLNDFVQTFSDGQHRVRLTLDRWGSIEITSTLLPSIAQDQLTFVIAPEIMNPDNLFLYHKTTHRAFYDDARVTMQKNTRCDEVVFLNNRGELTEGSFTNIFIEIDGELLTPALTCGLLAGTLRQELIEQGKVKEAVLTFADLDRATQIFLGNSVRGLTRAVEHRSAQ